MNYCQSLTNRKEKCQNVIPRNLKNYCIIHQNTDTSIILNNYCELMTHIPKNKSFEFARQLHILEIEKNETIKKMKNLDKKLEYYNLQNNNLKKVAQKDIISQVIFYTFGHLKRRLLRKKNTKM